MKINIITIDGPAGSGKGKIAKYVAKKWKLKHLDSGIFYRRLAYIISKKKINPIDKITIKILINDIDQISSQKNKILRSEKISNIASIIAEYKFDDLCIDKSNKLLKSLNIDHITTKPMPLSDIYNYEDNLGVGENKKTKIGF